MHIDAIAKARQRHDDAGRARALIKATMDFDSLEARWSNFLTLGNGVYATLEKGARVSPQSLQWFGAKKRERRLDPLLNYLFQARHVAEHGISALLGRGPEIRRGERIDGSTKGSIYLGGWSNDEGMFEKSENADGTELFTQVTPPDSVLLPIYNDKYDQTFPPPDIHLGTPLTSRSPLAIGSLWLAYLSGLIEEAAQLPQRTLG